MYHPITLIKVVSLFIVISKQMRRSFLAVALAAVWFGFLAGPKAFGVSPAPDGGYAGENTAEGTNALFSLSSGIDNTAIGFDALFSNTTGSENTAVGVAALDSNISGSLNTAIGYETLVRNTGDNNTAVGANALLSNTSGHANTATGVNALFNNTTGISNTAYGLGALQANTNGHDNTATGIGALEKNMGGSFNTAIGGSALDGNTTGNSNTASGLNALFFNTNGSNNTAQGVNALLNNTSAGNNSANGAFSLQNNGAGHDNTAHGFQALKGNTSGNNNIAVGSNAGANLTTGSNNIELGANVFGAPAEANTIRIGKQGTQKQVFIGGIFGTPVTGSTVVVSSTGKLGVATSSMRFKQAIKPMDKASETILALRPVTFRYKNEIDSDGTPQFGLVAEEVEKVNPDLVGRDEEGKVNTVRYEAINAMLLNEFLKEHQKVEQLQAMVEQLRTNAAKQESTNAIQEKQIETLMTGLQNVSEQDGLNHLTASSR